MGHWSIPVGWCWLRHTFTYRIYLILFVTLHPAIWTAQDYMYEVWTGHIMTGEWLLTVGVEIFADIERVADW